MIGEDGEFRVLL